VRLQKVNSRLGETKMQIFVYLFDAIGVVPLDARVPINLYLQSLFNQVTAYGGSNDNVTVAWLAGVPNLGAADLLMYYFCKPYSLMVQAGSSSGKVPADSGGLTVFGLPNGNGTLSEVRPAQLISSPQQVANLTFHEFMHNKLQVGDNGHTDGLFTDPLGSTLSQGNMAQMAPVLSRSISQFSRGMTILSSDLSAQNSNDPLAVATVPWADINVGQ
jgi:hypothetical protein